MVEYNEQQIEQIDERIDKFIRGKMTPSEEATFKNEVVSDEYIRERAKELLILAKGTKEFGASEDQKVIQAVQSSKNKAKIISLSSFKFAPVYLAAAAVACFFINSHIIYNNAISYGVSSSEMLLNSMDDSSRGVLDEVDFNELKSLFANAVAGKDSETTINKLSDYYKISKDENVDDIDDYSSRIGWFLAIAYLNKGDEDNAKLILKEIVTDNPNAENAIELLDKLNSTFFWQ